jgi:hypothetical protein
MKAFAFRLPQPRYADPNFRIKPGNSSKKIARRLAFLPTTVTGKFFWGKIPSMDCYKPLNRNIE